MIKMKHFKLKRGRSETIRINKEEFEDHGLNKYPYEIKGAGNKPRQYGICPACDNPIQLIGLYSTETTIKPYGKHCGKDMPIGIHNEQAYYYRPYATHKYEVNRDSRKRDLTQLERDIYYTARDNFDIAVKIIQQDTGIYVSRKLAAELLDCFVGAKAHMYFHASIYNIPWMFLYFLETMPCTNFLIKEGSAIYGHLVQRKDTELFPSYIKGYFVVKGKGRKWLDLDLMFSQHNRYVDNEDNLHEYLQMMLITTKQVGTTKREYRQKLEINEYRFPNWIVSEKAQKHRNQFLLDMAKEHMPDLPEEVRLWTG